MQTNALMPKENRFLPNLRSKMVVKPDQPL